MTPLATTGCVCNPETGVECRLHARAPKRCPECAAAGRDGMMTYVPSGHVTVRNARGNAVEGTTRVPYVPTTAAGFIEKGTRVKFYPRNVAFRGCGTCEHVEVV